MSSFVNGRILVVDDTPANLSLLLDALTEAGHEILVAEGGRSALSLLEHTTPDLVLLDFIMPGMDGVTTCRRLKERPECRDVPVLFMTAVDDPGQKLRAFEAGALDYITKPVYPPEVLARVSAHLQIRALQKSVEDELAMRLAGHNFLAPNVMGEKRDIMNRMQQAAAGAAFDRMFLQVQQQGHQELLNLTGAIMAGNAPAPDKITAILANGQVREHLILIGIMLGQNTSPTAAEMPRGSGMGQPNASANPR